MALKIRLARGGAKKRPYYRVVVADSRMPRDGRFIERIGSYNPMVPKDHEDRLKLDGDKIKDWMGKGAQPTDRVAKLMAQAGLGDAPAIPTQTKKTNPKPKPSSAPKKKAEKAREARLKPPLPLLKRLRKNKPPHHHFESNPNGLDSEKSLPCG